MRCAHQHESPGGPARVALCCVWLGGSEYHLPLLYFQSACLISCYLCASVCVCVCVCVCVFLCVSIQCLARVGFFSAFSLDIPLSPTHADILGQEIRQNRGGYIVRHKRSGGASPSFCHGFQIHLFPYLFSFLYALKKQTGRASARRANLFPARISQETGTWLFISLHSNMVAQNAVGVSAT